MTHVLSCNHAVDTCLIILLKTYLLVGVSVTTMSSWRCSSRLFFLHAYRGCIPTLSYFWMGQRRLIWMSAEDARSQQCQQCPQSWHMPHCVCSTMTINSPHYVLASHNSPHDAFAPHRCPWKNCFLVVRGLQSDHFEQWGRDSGCRGLPGAGEGVLGPPGTPQGSPPEGGGRGLGEGVRVCVFAK